MENLYTPNCIRTVSGIYFNILDPKEEMIKIEDIAHSLSMQPRFGGHLPKFYSVAQHCCLMSSMMPDQYKIEALLHDASEAYLMDIPSPVKKELSNYKTIEDQLMNLIANVFNFNYPLSEEVKNVDKLMLETEWEILMLGKESRDEIICWTQQEAKDTFLSIYYKYIYNS